MAVTFSDIIADRLNKGYSVPDRVMDVRNNTPGLTEAMYTRNVLDSLGNTYPWVTEELEAPKTTTNPTLNYIFGKLGIHDDEGAAQGKGRTALRKFIDDFPSMMNAKDDGWKKKIEDDPEMGARGWDTVVDLWKQAVRDDAEEQTKKNMKDAVNDGTVAGFITRTALPRTTERIANTGDFEWKDVGLDALENGMMAVPGGMYMRAPVKAASLVGKGMSKVGLGGTKASQVLANLPGHVTNLSNKLAAKWGSNLPGTVALGIGKTARNFAGNSVTPFVMEGVDDAVYDEGEGMDERADFSAGDAFTGAAVNHLANRGLARLGQAMVPQMEGSVAVRSPAVLKMRQILSNIGEPSYQVGDDFAAGVRAAASTPNRPAGTYTPSEVRAMRSGKVGDEGSITSLVTPEEAEEAALSSTILDAIDRGDIKLHDKPGVNVRANAVKEGAANRVKREKAVAQVQGEQATQELNSINKEIGELLSEQFELETKANLTPEQAQRLKDIERLLIAKSGKATKLENEAVNAHNAALRKSTIANNSSAYLKPESYFNLNGLLDKVSYMKPDGTYVNRGIPYTPSEIDAELGKHINEYVNYANWHGKPSRTPTNMQRILGLVDNPTAAERLINDAKVTLPTLAVNKAGREDFTKNLMQRIDPTDEIKKEREETHAAPGQRVRKATAKKILSDGGDTLSEDSRKYLAYLTEHPDAVKTGHTNPAERSKFNLWLLTEGRQLLEGTPLHRPVWEIDDGRK